MRNNYKREAKGLSGETCYGYRDWCLPLPDLPKIPNVRFNLERIDIPFK